MELFKHPVCVWKYALLNISKITRPVGIKLPMFVVVNVNIFSEYIIRAVGYHVMFTMPIIEDLKFSLFLTNQLQA